MKYADAREFICTGDLVAVRKSHGFLPTLTRWVTLSPYTHTAIAIWVELAGIRRLLVAEAKASGAFLTPLSQYAETEFDVFPSPRLVSLARVEEAVIKTLGLPIAYDFMDLVRIGLNRLVGWPLPKCDDERKVCSSLSAFIWKEAGWIAPKFLPSIPSPVDVVEAQGSWYAKIEVRPTGD